MSLKVFVYGTLKTGYANHNRLCSKACDIRNAVVRGRVLDRPEGFPVLFVPTEDILAVGSHNHHRDARLQQQTCDCFTFPENPLHRLVRGQIIEFKTVEPHLADLDALESFHPSRPSMYCRVMLSVLTARSRECCWAYISPHCAEMTEDVIRKNTVKNR